MELRLRFREHDGVNEPPDVEAFLRRRPSSSAGPEGTHPGSIEPTAEPEEPIGVLASGERLEPDAPLMVFFRRLDYVIPAPGVLRRDALPDLSSWSLRPTVFGWLASVPPPRSDALRSRAVAWIVAACLPIVLPSEVMAAPRPELPPIQVPEVEGNPGSEASTESEPASDPEPEETPTTTFDPTDAPPVSLPAPASSLDTGGSNVDQATIDAAWEGVDGFDVELELKGGGSMRGRVGAVQADTFTLIQAKTGAVLVLPKASVVSLRVRTPPPMPTRNGGGAIAGGSVLTALGAPVFITGVTFLAICPSCTAIHVPMLLLGGGALGGGIPLLVRGARQRREYQEALQERALAPVVFRTPHGWTGGIRFRF
jgi:hypothetical protein